MPAAFNFTANPETGQCPLAVTFSLSVGFAANYLVDVEIDFGDGSPLYTNAGGPGIDSIEVTHIYTSPGSYTAEALWKTDVSSTPISQSVFIDTYEQTIFVTPTPATGNIVSGSSPFEITINGVLPTGGGYIYDVEIDFGDGSPLYTNAGGPGTTTINVIHTYSTPGSYVLSATYFDSILGWVGNGYFLINVTAGGLVTTSFKGVRLNGVTIG